MLEPSFPVFGFVSHPLNLAEEHSSRLARAYMNKAIDVARQTGRQLASMGPSDFQESIARPLGKTSELDREKYYVKRLDDYALSKGLWLFCEEYPGVAKRLGLDLD